MMTENLCTYPGLRDDVIVSYLYDELQTADRAAFERHLMVCALCRTEVDSLGGVRASLGSWAPPELAGHVTFALTAPAAPRKTIGSAFREIPAWARVAAAVLVLGVSAGLANLEVSYSGDGLSVRTGWRHPVRVENVAPNLPSSSSVAQTASSAAPWRSDLAALEDQLRQAIETRPLAATSASATTQSDEAVMRRVRALIDESNHQQQRELALRLAELARERQADLVKIDRSLGLIHSQNTMDVMRTQRQVNSLAQQVSQRP